MSKQRGKMEKTTDPKTRQQVCRMTAHTLCAGYVHRVCVCGTVRGRSRWRGREEQVEGREEGEGREEQVERREVDKEHIVGGE